MNDEIKIEKNIPIPNIFHPRSGISEVLRKMKAGESIFIKGKNTSDVAGIIRNAGLHGGKTTSRTMDGGVRIWRIK